MSKHPKCQGCNATVVVQPGDTPDKATVFHPEPLCPYVLALLEAGIAVGPVVPATFDRNTGELAADPWGVN
jgi:hypothetical protein